MTTTPDCPQGPENPDDVEALFPEGSNPGVRFGKLSAVCAYGLTQLVCTGALRHFLIQHFSDIRNILNATLRERLKREGVWSSDRNEHTGIIIESLHRWTPELTESRPAIIIKEGTWNWERKGIGDSTGVDQRTGTRHFSGFWNGSHVFFALATEAAEAQHLGTETLKCLQWFSQEISEQLNMHRFIPVSIGEVAALQESSEHYVVPVVFGYTIEDSWKLQPEAPRLKRIVLSTKDVLAGY